MLNSTSWKNCWYCSFGGELNKEIDRSVITFQLHKVNVKTKLCSSLIPPTPITFCIDANRFSLLVVKFFFIAMPIRYESTASAFRGLFSLVHGPSDCYITVYFFYLEKLRQLKAPFNPISYCQPAIASKLILTQVPRIKSGTVSPLRCSCSRHKVFFIFFCKE